MANSRTLNDDDMVTDVIFIKQKVARTRWALGHACVVKNQPPFYLGGGEGWKEYKYVATATVCAMVHPQTQELSTNPCFHFYSFVAKMGKFSLHS